MTNFLPYKYPLLRNPCWCANYVCMVSSIVLFLCHSGIIQCTIFLKTSWWSNSWTPCRKRPKKAWFFSLLSNSIRRPSVGYWFLPLKISLWGSSLNPPSLDVLFQFSFNRTKKSFLNENWVLVSNRYFVVVEKKHLLETTDTDVLCLVDRRGS